MDKVSLLLLAISDSDAFSSLIFLLFSWINESTLKFFCGLITKEDDPDEFLLGFGVNRPSEKTEETEEDEEEYTVDLLFRVDAAGLSSELARGMAKLSIMGTV